MCVRCTAAGRLLGLLRHGLASRGDCAGAAGARGGVGSDT
jgi:hypothetical protein